MPISHSRWRSKKESYDRRLYKIFPRELCGMLQAYATTKMLEARGIDYELIQYEKRRTLSEKIMSVPRLLNGVLLNDKYEALKKRWA